MPRKIKYNKVRNFSDLSFPIKKSENKIYKFEKKVCGNDLLILEKNILFFSFFSYLSFSSLDFLPCNFPSNLPKSKGSLSVFPIHSF